MILRHLVESGAVERRDGRWSAESLTEGDLPQGVREVVGRRLSVLPEATQHLLSTASVVGARFELALLATVAARGEDEVLDDLEPALDAQLVIETGLGRYQFAHTLIRTTLRQELSTTRRARLHRSVAAAMVELHADDPDPVAADLAYHFSEAGSGAPAEALHYARRAAELAVQRLAPDEAVRWNRTVLELLEPEEAGTRAEILVSLAEAEELAGDGRWQDTQHRAARAALDVGDPALATRVLGIESRLVFTVDRRAARPGPGGPGRGGPRRHPRARPRPAQPVAHHPRRGRPLRRRPGAPRRAVGGLASAGRADRRPAAPGPGVIPGLS